MKRKTRRRIFYATVYLIGLAVWYAIIANSIPKPTHSVSYLTQYGDTLWDIAKMSDSYNDIDCRYIIEDIEKLSDCDANIKAGQLIHIPMYKGANR